MEVTSIIPFQFSSLQAYPLRHGLSQRDTCRPAQGDVAHSRGSDGSSIEANRAVFLASVGIQRADLTLARQTHGSAVRVVTRDDRGRGLYPSFDGYPDTDGLITNDPAVALGVIVADCVPLVLYDPVQHAIAVVHAGWRGTVRLIGAAAIDRMASAYGSRPVDIVAGIGPSIGPCCYEVGVEVIDAWACVSETWGTDAIVQSSSSYHFDLWSANRQTLIEAGVSPERIEIGGVCVKCAADRFFSYRATRQDGAQRGSMMMAVQLDDVR